MAQSLADHRKEAHHLSGLQENLKQIVYGGNDGIVTTFAIVAGFAGAGSEGTAQIGAIAVLVFGLANLFADAVSMGLGEFLSTRSQRDLYLTQRRIEERELAENPEAEREELIAMMRARGLPEAAAQSAADALMQSPELVVDMMMSYELEMDDMRAATPAWDGMVTFVAFTLFGAIPLLPYFMRDPDVLSFQLSIAATLSALVLLGLLRWYASREAVLRCVGETVLVGSVCAVVAYGVGAIVGG
ncbi:VIT1/CCC1 transporter family protein [Alphaproteobacteria bacterium KMM 3653]|uniref:VIT1/CCC1 transporter family protein n=1 Tax=Harenicola maris TaxID=2841044 RepID=A0AAP2CMZ0_9RHOB|nr:VIT1/CCC1 transporter family protein [Harenicola maris]